MPTYPDPISDTVAVSVAPTPTVMGGPYSGWLSEQVVLRVENTDASQTLDAWLEFAWSDDLTYDLQQENYFMAIPAVTARQKTVNIQGQPVFRVMGQASGAGLTANFAIRRIPKARNT